MSTLLISWVSTASWILWAPAEKNKPKHNSDVTFCANVRIDMLRRPATAVLRIVLRIVILKTTTSIAGGCITNFKRLFKNGLLKCPFKRRRRRRQSGRQCPRYPFPRGYPFRRAFKVFSAKLFKLNVNKIAPARLASLCYIWARICEFQAIPDVSCFNAKKNILNKHFQNTHPTPRHRISWGWSSSSQVVMPVVLLAWFGNVECSPSTGSWATSRAMVATICLQQSKAITSFFW